MSEAAAVNTSPLIILSRIGMLELLRVAGDPIVIPSPVSDEVHTYGPDDVTVRAIAEIDWLTVAHVSVIPPVLQAFNLGRGETAVLAWAIEHSGATAIIDDDAARRRARELNIPTVGTLGLILGAKESGLIGQAGPLIERARREGLYLSDQLVRRSLQRVDE